MELIFGFALAVLYVPGIAGAATTPRWALLAVGLPLLLLRSYPPGKLTWAHLFGLGFLAWATTSLIWTPNRLDGIGELIKLAILAQVFVLGSSLSTLVPILRGMAWGLLASSICILIQLWIPDIVLHSTTNSGLFVNSGSLAEITALVIIGLMFAENREDALWPRFMVIALLPCLVLPMSRGAYLALVAAVVVWLWSKSRLAALGIVIACAAVLAISLHAGFHTASVAWRIDMWRNTAAMLTWRGHGLGAFWTDYALASIYDTVEIRPEYPHFDGLGVLFELGVGGCLMFAAAVAAVSRGRDLCARLVFAGFIAESLVGFPLHVPCTAALAALCLGRLSRDGADLRGSLAMGRIRLRAWHGRRRAVRRSRDAVAPGREAVSA